MKICVYGAGAIGGYLGARLAGTPADVALVARGPHLEAMRSRGLTLLTGAAAQTVAVHCTDDPRTLGPQDYVILTLKAHSTPGILDHLQPLLGPDTAVVTAQNGILWWYFHAFPGPLQDRHLEAADPRGQIWRALGPERAIGCVVYPSCEIVAPGVVRHIEGTRFMVGEPDGSKSARVVALGEVLTAAGLKAPVRSKIRDDIWFKLLGNATFNPVSVLTRATLGHMGRDPDVRDVIRRLMSEAVAVATSLGVSFAMDIEKRIDAAVDVGAHRTSMLQDFEQGRPLELDALVAAVTEMGRLVGVPTPTLDQVLALVRLAVASRP
ncbi:MAG: 2-dehydropantoate 2-reductase [Gammaproteobacteria bacterium]|nr:2-dehydropantoate 2-reductase [Gammaproteobacteria bacterium]